MSLPLSRFAQALALAAMATLGVVAQTPDAPAVGAAPAETAPADTQKAADLAGDAAVETEVPADVPAEPTPVAEPEAAEVAEVSESAAPAEESVMVTPVEPAPQLEPAPTAAVVPAAPAPAGPICCPIHVIDYRTTLSAKRAYRCYGPGVNTSVCVDNPADCTGTHYEVPLCVPACCTGAPRVCPSTGLLGRGKVDLVWDCGFTATVVFRVHGGAIVIYQG